jgi:hypothetical protein
MTYFEVRLFGANGNCFRVHEFQSYQEAEKRFSNSVSQSKRLHKLIEIEPFVSKVVAHQIQMVERDNAMTWLVEHNNWAAA